MSFLFRILFFFFFLNELFPNTIEEKLETLKKRSHFLKSKKEHTLELGITYLFAENFKKSFTQFEKLYQKDMRDPSNLFYMAMIQSLNDKKKASFLWKNYFLDKVVQVKRKIWLNLGILIQEVISNNVDFSKNKEKFKSHILFFYLNKAYYTSILNINLFEKYFVNKKDLKNYHQDMNFIARVKSGILSNINFKLDAIKIYEKYRLKTNLNNRNLVKLGILYYQNKFYIQATETFNQIQPSEQKNFTYYYFLALTYYKLEKKKLFEKNKKLAKSWIINKEQEKLYQILTSLK